MRADDDNWRRTGDRRSLRRTQDFRLYIVTRLSLHLVAVSSGSETGTRKRVFNKIGSGIELCVMPHVALADFSRELLHIRAELFTQYNFIRRERPRLENVLPRHPHSKPPE
jgi:hypothetical protein